VPVTQKSVAELEQELQALRAKYPRGRAVSDVELSLQFTLQAAIKKAKQREAKEAESNRAALVQEFDQTLRHARNAHADCRILEHLADLRKQLTVA
jgi:hypothetical protein